MLDTKWVIIWLSLQITGLSILVTKQAYDLGYERGRIKVLTTFDDSSSGTCFAKGGCDNDPSIKTPKRH